MTEAVGGCELHCGDAMRLLREMPDVSVDAVITDPPFAEKTHAGARTTRPGVGLTTVPLIGFGSIDDDTFLGLCSEFVRVARRWCVLTCDWRHSAAAFRSGLPVVRCGVWVKPDAAPQFSGDRPGTGWESVLMLHRPGRKRWNGGGHHAVWTHGLARDNVHPTQKPTGLVRQWLKQFTDPGDLVFDPFAGSFTTGVACVQTGRRFVGIEKESKYVEIGVRRIKEVECVGSLFDPEVVAP
jgi:site-specific DNA-methyltransferase (adenine-specific)